MEIFLAVPSLLSNLQFDLSYTAMELVKLLTRKIFSKGFSWNNLIGLFSASLVSKNETLETAALASIRALARQITNGEIVLNIVQYLFNILNGLSNK